MLSVIVTELHPQVDDADKLKELVLGSKRLLPQLFFFGTVTSPKFGVWALDKKALLDDLRARAVQGATPLAKVKLVAGEDVNWYKSGFFACGVPADEEEGRPSLHTKQRRDPL